MAAQKQARMDVARLDRLLTLAGPVAAVELLVRLDEDLGGVAAALPLAVAGADRQMIRTQTHVLIAVAGAVGADGLAADARTLNAAAQGDGPFPAPLIRRMTLDLASLRDLIAARRAGDGTRDPE